MHKKKARDKTAKSKKQSNIKHLSNKHETNYQILETQ